MSIDTHLTDDTGQQPALEAIGEVGDSPGQVVEVRRRPGLAAALGAGASLVALAYLTRAATGGGALDWALGIALGLLGVANLVLLVDARVPLLVADDLGVRLRLGRTWVGLPWGGLHEVEHRARAGWWRDGLLTVRTHYVQRVIEDLDPSARRIAGVNRRLHGSPLAIPLGLGTRVHGGRPDLSNALRELADSRTPVVEVAPKAVAPAPVVDEEPLVDEEPVPADQAFEEQVLDDLPRAEPVLDDHPREPAPAPRRWRDPRPAIAHLIGEVAARFERPARETTDDTELPDPAYPPQVVFASETPVPVRAPLSAARAEVRHVSQVQIEPEIDPDRDFDVVAETWEPLPTHPEPEAEPVIGPQFAAARQRLGLTVDGLAERTRIRPHVIEAIEIDDFGACGGDFYARGHLRTLARVLGVEGAPVLATYDELYADAPIDPRAVFEADLAGAGTLRATRGGPNWSVLVAAVMALVLCWSVARLVTGGPGESPDRAVLSGSGGPNHSRSVLTKPVPVVLTAAGGGARVVVRDGMGKLVFAGNLAYGQKHTVQASTPVRVQSTDGSVEVTVDGQDRGRMGPAGRPTSRSYNAHP